MRDKAYISERDTALRLKVSHYEVKVGRVKLPFMTGEPFEY